MKLSKKQQAAVLAAALVLVAAGGTAAFLLTGKDSPKPESSLSAENSATEASQTATNRKRRKARFTRIPCTFIRGMCSGTPIRRKTIPAWLLWTALGIRFWNPRK